MKGLKKHTHKDREEIIKKMIPMIKKKFGKNLIALAAQASFARNEDRDYSDLELIAFVKKMPRGKKWAGIGKIKDGLMVELVWQTKEDYIKSTLEINDYWYISGSDKLIPLINKKFIKAIQNYKTKNFKKKCLNFAAKNWYEAQESTAKVLNAIAQKNRDGLSLLAPDMFLRILIVLSFLNQKPYTTFARFVTEAKRFRIKPRGFNKLAEIMIHGEYSNLPKLEKIVRRVFSEFEKIFEALGIDPYEDNLDPNIPYKRDFFD